MKIKYEWMIIGNIVWFGMWMYVVFALHQNPWWMALPVCIHFSESEDNE